MSTKVLVPIDLADVLHRFHGAVTVLALDTRRHMSAVIEINETGHVVNTDP